MPTSVVAASGFDLGRILHHLCVNLQLNPTQFDRAEQSYGAVTSWLADDESALSGFRPLLYPQGSLLLDTTVRPIGQAEFDLDVVCVLNMARGRSPSPLYDLIWDRMYAHKTYRSIMERKERCIRLNYAEESQFHLDIVPAIINTAKGGDHILIADKIGDQMMIDDNYYSRPATIRIPGP